MSRLARTPRIRLAASRLGAVLATVAVLASAATSRVAARASAPPTFFPAGFGMSSTAYSLRFAGADRYATAGTAALMSAVDENTTTGWPFNSPDATGPKNAYGAGACPGTVFIVASDGLPDALAASALRGLASLALSGQPHAFNTYNALLLLTGSARTGATHLDAETRTALEAIRQACPGGFDAIILGGTAAVASGVGTDLASIANTVGRIGGADRFDTAAQVAVAIKAATGLGTLDYYASNTDTASPKGGAIFLAEGFTGADALSVGPIAAERHVPVLLATSSALPAATASALRQLQPSNLVVLGGTGALGDSVVSVAARAGGTTNGPIRIAGDTRYGTSVAIAEQLDDLWPANAANSQGQDTDAFTNQGFGLARSEGSGSAQQGWPDALASAFMLANLHLDTTVPKRFAPPIEDNANGTRSSGSGALTLGGVRPGHTSPYPLLLTPVGSLDPEVSSFLSGLYPVSSNMVTMANTGNPPLVAAPSDPGGFVYVFGGPAAVSPAAELQAALDVSGATYTTSEQSDLSPVEKPSKVFYTALDLSNYKAAKPGDGGMFAVYAAGDKLCDLRDGLAGASLWDVTGSSGIIGAPVPPYEAGSQSFPAGQSQPFCLDVSNAPGQSVAVTGVSLSGSFTNRVVRTWSSSSETLRTGAPAGASAPSNGSTVSGVPGIYASAVPGSPTVAHLIYPNIPVTVAYRGQSYTTGSLDIEITRTNESFSSSNSSGNVDDRITCMGTFTETSGSAVVFEAALDAESATAPITQPGPSGVGASGPIACVGEYSIGGATGGVHFTLTQASPSDTGTSSKLGDLMLDGNA